MPPIPLTSDSLPAHGPPQAGAIDTRAALARTRAAAGTASILPGLDLSWSVPLDRRSVCLDVLAKGIVVWSATLDGDKACERLTANQGPFKEDVVFCVDLADGEITITGDVCVDTPSGWQCHRFPTTVLVAWSPTLGAVGGQIEAHPPAVNDPTFGASTSIVPTITRIPVDAVQRAGTPVGSMVKQALFADAPDFLFNVCFAVGPFQVLRPGDYGDPTSIWFNVFTGYYEIDCPKPAWSRPFGYTLSGGPATVAFDDLLRIAKADWNYFSNWMYGVPLDVVEPFDRPDPGVVCRDLGRVAVGNTGWDLVDVDGFTAVSAYQSSAAGAAQLVENTALTPLWRITYGEPNSQSGHDQSFPGTTLRAQLYMSYSEDETSFRTYIFGGTVNKAFPDVDNARFLEEQMAACRQVMIDRYPDLGFPRSAAGLTGGVGRPLSER